MPTEELAIPICRHLKTNGLRCQSPALNGEPFCYFHVRLHKHHPAPLTARQIVDARNRAYEGYEEAVIGGGEDPMLIARAYPNQNEFNFPPLEDAESIQLAASMLFHAIAQGHVHLRRARLLRDMLRVAAMSCRLSKPNPDVATSAVCKIDHTPEGLAIARADTSSSPGPEEPGVTEAVAIARADASSSPGPEEPGATQAAAIASAGPPSQPADSAPVQPSDSEPAGVGAPHLDSEMWDSTPSSSSQPTSNQDFICNPLGDNILPESPGATGTNSGFCDFFDAGYGSPWRDLGGRPTLNAGAPS